MKLALPAATAAFQSREYLVQYLDQDQNVIAVGAVTVELPPVPVTAQPVTFAIDDTRITGVAVDRQAIGWNARPGLASFEYRPAGSTGAWVAIPVQSQAAGARPFVSLAGLNGTFDWRISYSDADEGGGLAAVQFGTVVISTPLPVLSQLGSSEISGFSTGPARISWTRPAGASGLLVQVQDGNSGQWVAMSPTDIVTENGRDVVDLSRAIAGQYAVLITYTTAGVVTHLMRGTVSIASPGTVTAASRAVQVNAPSATRLSWTDVPGAGAATFLYRPKGQAAWQGDLRVSVVDGLPGVDIGGLDGLYDYRVSYSSGGEVTALAIGELVIDRPVPLLSDVDGAVLRNMSLDSTRWSWDKPARGVGVGRYRLAGGAWSEDVPVLSDGQRDYIPLVDGTPGSYDYRITYTDDGMVSAFSAGVIVIPPPATLTGVDRADVVGLLTGPGTLSWTANPAGTAGFAVRSLTGLGLGSGSWVSLEVRSADGRHRVDLTGLQGAYDYRITYTLVDGSLVALDTGRLDATTQMPALASQGDSRLPGFTSSSTRVLWPKKPGTLAIEYREGTDAFRPVTGPDVIIGATQDGLDLTNSGVMRGEFRITYTVGGLVTAMALGTITGAGWTQPVPSSNANVSGFSATSGTLTWTSSHTGTGQFFYRNTNGGMWTQGPAISGSGVSIALLSNVSASADPIGFSAPRTVQRGISCVSGPEVRTYWGFKL